MWAKACLNLQMRLLFKGKNLTQIAKSCALVIKLDKRNISFVENKLWEYLQSNP
jgi:hypothetical protein